MLLWGIITVSSTVIVPHLPSSFHHLPPSPLHSTSTSLSTYHPFSRPITTFSSPSPRPSLTLSSLSPYHLQPSPPPSLTSMFLMMTLLPTQ